MERPPFLGKGSSLGGPSAILAEAGAHSCLSFPRPTALAAQVQKERKSPQRHGLCPRVIPLPRDLFHSTHCLWVPCLPRHR